MKKIFVIFKKEFIDTIRDRRTLIMMVVLPLFLIPMILNLTTGLSMSHARKAREKVLNVGLLSYGNAETFRQMLLERKDMIIREEIKSGQIENLIQEKQLDFAFVFDEAFDRKVAENGSGDIQLYFKTSSEIKIAKKRILDILKKYKNDLLNSRLEELKLEFTFVEPLKIHEHDIATVKERIGEYIGGFLPYIFILFCFLGAMYPAIDLAAGEKERATLETLLTSPASRMQIVIGKFLVITIAGLVSAGLSMVSLFISVKTLKEIPSDIVSTIYRIIEFESTVLLLSLLIPLCVFFAAILLSISVFAKSFKEAQSIMTPMNFVVIVPVLIGLIPGIKLNPITALIPVLNVSLATREIVSGTIKTGLLIEVYLSLFIIAAASLYFCSQWFKRESVIFRGI